MRSFIKVFSILLAFQVCLYSQINNPKNKLVYRGPYRTNEHPLFLHVNDTISGNWSYLTQLPHALVGVNSIYIPELNKIFICGGADQNANPTNKCYLYNLNTNMYETADTLPTPRWLGKLVRVKDSLYLVSASSSNFYYPDGAIYKYDINNNYWEVLNPMPPPYVIESAVCVWHDSIIVNIGGSTSGYSSPTDMVRLFTPSATIPANVWITVQFPFYQPTTASQSECGGENIIVVGGINGGDIYNDVINCSIGQNVDSTGVSWAIDSIGDPNSFNGARAWIRLGDSPYPRGVYRAASGQYWGSLGGNYQWEAIPIFGPAIYSTLDTLLDFGQFWAFTFEDSHWHRFIPNTLDSVGNVSTVAINPTNDSIYFYFFGGNDNQLNILNKAEKYAFANPVIGIHGISNKIPNNFILYQNYPNPFNPTTIIDYEIPRASDVKIYLYDVLGREVRILVNEHKSPGRYSYTFNDSGISSGVYFYTLYAGNYRNTKKLVVLK